MVETKKLFSASKGNLKKKSLILAGGGMRLAYQAGVLLALEEKDFQFQHVDGTSGGIFNAAMLASNVSPVEMAERWRTLKVKNFVSMRKFGRYLSPFSMQGYADADNIRDKVFPHLGINLKTINDNEEVNATFNVCNFTDKSIESIPSSEVKLEHLLAGVSLPIVMPAQKIEGKWYSDAVWIKDANILEAVKQGAEELWLVWAIGNCKDYLPGALNQYVHMIEMSANGALLEDYEQIKLKSKNWTEQAKIKLFVIKPEFPLPLDPDLFFDKIDTRSLVNMGYADARSFLAQIPDSGVPMDIEATKMKDPGVRLNIRNIYEGQLVWGKQPTEFKLYTYLRLSKWDANLKLTVFGSLFIGLLNKEIPLFDTITHIQGEKGKKKFNLEAKFLSEGRTYVLSAKWSLDAPIDILLGIGFKKIDVTIKKTGMPSEDISCGWLYQPIKHRIKSIIRTNLRTAEGRPGGFRKKFALLSKLASYEV